MSFYLLLILGFCHCDGKTLSESPSTTNASEETSQITQEAASNESLGEKGGKKAHLKDNNSSSPRIEIDPITKERLNIFTFDQIKNMSAEEIRNFENPDGAIRFENLSQWPIWELSLTQFNFVFLWMYVHRDFYRPNGYYHHITKEQMQNLNFWQIATLSRTSLLFSINMKYFSPEQVQALKAENMRLPPLPPGMNERDREDEDGASLMTKIGPFTPEQTALFNLEQIQAMFASSYVYPRQVEVIPPEFFSHLHYLHVTSAVTCEQASYITIEQIKKIKRLSKIPSGIIGCLSPEQIAAFEKFQYVSPHQMAQLSVEQLKALGQPDAGFVSRETLIAMTFEQMLVFKEGRTIGHILSLISRDDEDLKKSVFEKHSTFEGYDYFIPFLRPHHFRLIDDHMQVVGVMSNKTLLELTPERIANFPHFTKIMAPVARKLSQWQVRAIIPKSLKNTYREVMAAFSHRQLEFLTKEQLSLFSNSKDLKFLIAFTKIARPPKEKEDYFVDERPYAEWLKAPSVNLWKVQAILEAARNNNAGELWIENFMKIAKKADIAHCLTREKYDESECEKNWDESLKRQEERRKKRQKHCADFELEKKEESYFLMQRFSMKKCMSEWYVRKVDENLNFIDVFDYFR